MTVAYCHDGHEYLVGDGYCHKCRIAELEQQVADAEEEERLTTERCYQLAAENVALKQAQQPPVGDDVLRGVYDAAKRGLPFEEVLARIPTEQPPVGYEEVLREAIRLFGLLDDIDTAEDMFKPVESAYYRYVNNKQKQRFNGPISADGYTIFWNGAALKEGETATVCKECGNEHQQNRCPKCGYPGK